MGYVSRDWAPLPLIKLLTTKKNQAGPFPFSGQSFGASLACTGVRGTSYVNGSSGSRIKGLSYQIKEPPKKPPTRQRRRRHEPVPFLMHVDFPLYDYCYDRTWSQDLVGWAGIVFFQEHGQESRSIFACCCSISFSSPHTNVYIYTVFVLPNVPRSHDATRDATSLRIRAIGHSILYAL